jgi:4-hydroxy-2-oxoheptanedioate aldolase
MRASLPWPFGSPSRGLSVAEIAGAWGLDAVIIDLEHTTMSLDTAERIIMASESASVTPIVRPPRLDTSLIGRLLDAGAQGIVFPRVEDGREAANARMSLHHAPMGTRGWGGAHTRHAMWQGSSALMGRLPADKGVYTRDYVEKARSDVLSVFLIETVRAVENIEDILDAGRPDAVDFGRGDYSAAVGFDDAACDEAFDSVVRACRERGIGMNIPPNRAEELFYPGCYTIVGLDALLLSRAIQDATSDARGALHAATGPDRGAPP